MTPVNQKVILRSDLFGALCTGKKTIHWAQPNEVRYSPAYPKGAER